MAAPAGSGHDRGMASTTAPDDTTDTPAPPPPAAGNRFFEWMRGLGLTRQPGWIGGVCAGLAARLGIDPLIVRGIVVVLAVLGGPAFLLYAAAWLLLPDANDKIHLEQLIRGKLESPIAGIGALVLLSLLPIAQGFWYTGALYWGEPSWGEAIGRAFWTLVVLAGIVAFVIWVSRRASGEPLVVPATTDDRPDTIPQPATATTVADPAAPVVPPRKPTLPEPPRLAPDATPEDVAVWRAQQEAFKAERDAFRAQTAAHARETARLRAQEARERTAQFTAEVAAQRAAWQAANPRAGAAYGAIALGTAALAGGIAVIVSPLREQQPLTVGFAVAVIVLGLAIALAGILRRRTGFLTFVSVLVLIATLLSAVVPAGRSVLPLGFSYGLSNAVPGRYFQPAGNLTITLDPSLGGGTIDVWQGAGTIDVRLVEGMTARVAVESRDGEVWLGDGTGSAYAPLDGLALSDGTWRSNGVYGTGTVPTVTVRIWQGSGSITITEEETR